MQGGYFADILLYVHTTVSEMIAHWGRVMCRGSREATCTNTPEGLNTLLGWRQRAVG